MDNTLERVLAHATGKQSYKDPKLKTKHEEGANKVQI